LAALVRVCALGRGEDRRISADYRTIQDMAQQDMAQQDMAQQDVRASTTHRFVGCGPRT
jgi:hypothetical protein